MHDSRRTHRLSRSRYVHNVRTRIRYNQDTIQLVYINLANELGSRYGSPLYQAIYFKCSLLLFWILFLEINVHIGSAQQTVNV